MKENSRNIYQAARMAAGMTQERAAELLGCSVRTIAAYEQDERIPFYDTVDRMIDIYQTPFLAVQNLRANAALARQVLPAVQPTNLSQAFLHLQKEMNDFLKLRDEMLDIVDDGVIDPAERPQWDAIVKELNDICQAIVALECVDGGGAT
jgi:transcriptional regulator with XRE-family HTH domain